MGDASLFAPSPPEPPTRAARIDAAEAADVRIFQAKASLWQCASAVFAVWCLFMIIPIIIFGIRLATALWAWNPVF